MRRPELNPHSAQFKEERISRDYKEDLKSLSAEELIIVYEHDRTHQTEPRVFVDAFYNLKLQTRATQVVSEMRKRIDGNPAFTSSPFTQYLPKGVLKRNK